MPKTKKKSSPAKALKPIWSHSEASASDRADSELAIAYCAGRDMAGRPMADEALLPHDLQTNRAHCAMLCKCGIIERASLAAIERGLTSIERQHRDGAFWLDPALEDVHINVERAVAAISGERAAGVMHTARSRNDQTTTDIRLWLRDHLILMTGATSGLIGELAALARREARTVMAGWTHGQPAMAMTLGHWAAAHAYALTRDVQALRDLWPLINRSPLGAAAGFGSSWPIDRNLTAKLLGFDAPQSNSLDCVSTRWEAEARLGFALSMMMTHLSSLGQDLIFLSTPPRRLIELAPAFTTGSSIMPQKRNPDFAEVTRARAASVAAMTSAVVSVGRGALSGFNRDTQWTKYWIMDLVDEAGVAPRLFERAIATLRPNRSALAKTAGEDFVGAVDLADRIASSRGVPFRRLYHVIGRAVETDREAGGFKLETLNKLLKAERIAPPLTPAEFKSMSDPRLCIAARQSEGGPSPVSLRSQASELRAIASDGRRWAKQRRAALDRADRQLKAVIRLLISRR